MSARSARYQLRSASKSKSVGSARKRKGVRYPSPSPSTIPSSAEDDEDDDEDVVEERSPMGNETSPSNMNMNMQTSTRNKTGFKFWIRPTTILLLLFPLLMLVLAILTPKVLLSIAPPYSSSFNIEKMALWTQGWSNDYDTKKDVGKHHDEIVHLHKDEDVILNENVIKDKKKEVIEDPLNEWKMKIKELQNTIVTLSSTVMTMNATLTEFAQVNLKDGAMSHWIKLILLIDNYFIYMIMLFRWINMKMKSKNFPIKSKIFQLLLNNYSIR